MSPSICPLPLDEDAPSTSMSPSSSVPAPDWSRVKLGVDAAPRMFVANWSADTCCWDGGALVPYGPLSLMPAAQVLNYGQSIFEGLKAYRAQEPAPASTATPSSDPCSGASTSGRVLLFRPQANAERFAAGAVRMCMPVVPPAMFLAAVNAVVRANEAWVPPSSRGSLYLRPLLLGTGPLLGLCPAPSYTFVVYAIPVGGRAKDGRLAALDYLIHDCLHRAAPRGVGATKAAGNYSPCLMAQAEARAQGCADCIYLDAKSDTYLEEGSGCNVFAVHGRTLSTPPAAGSILPGVTRASLLALAGALGYRVRQAHISVELAMQANEMFASGTAVVVQPIGSVSYRGKRVAFSRPQPAAAIEPAASADLPAAPNGAGANGHANGEAVTPPPLAPPSPSPSLSTEEDDEADYVEAYGYGTSFEYGRPVELSDEEREALLAAAPELEAASLPPGVGPVAQRLYTLLTGIQYGRVADPFGWAVEVDMQGPTDGPLHLDELLGLELGTAAAAEAVPAGGKATALSAGGPGAKLTGVVPAGKSVFADPNLE